MNIDIMQHWPIIAAGFAGIVWLLRLEGIVKMIKKTQETEGDRLAKAVEKLAETQEKMGEAITDMRTTLAGVVGYEKGAQEARKGRR